MCEVAAGIQTLDDVGYPRVDGWCELPEGPTHERRDAVAATLASLRAGVHHMILPPCVDAAELRALADDWATRVSDYELLASGWLREEATRLGIRVIGYREIAALIPPDLSPAIAAQ